MNYNKIEENINSWFRFLILLYTDDVVVLANTLHELQEGINAIEKYCKLWKLTTIIVKTKVIVFRKHNCDILPKLAYSNTID